MANKAFNPPGQADKPNGDYFDEPHGPRLPIADATSVRHLCDQISNNEELEVMGFLAGQRKMILLSVALVGFAPAVAADIIESLDEQSAIRELFRRGAVVKRFDVKEAETTGQLVRFRAEHLDRDGCLLAELLDPLVRMPRVAVEFRGLPLTDIGLKRLALKARLIGLDLSGTNVTDRGLAELNSGDLPHRESLRLLDLSFTRITDEGLKSISEWKHLRHISVIACSVTDTGIESLSALPELRKSYLTNTRVTAAAVSRWRQKTPRCRIEH